jgi:hypothetical protein
MELRIKRYHYTIEQHGVEHSSCEDVLQWRISELHDWEDVPVIDVLANGLNKDEDKYR